MHVLRSHSVLYLQELLRHQSPEPYSFHSRHLWVSLEWVYQGRWVEYIADYRFMLYEQNGNTGASSAMDLNTCFSSIHDLWSFLLLRSSKFQRDAGLGGWASPHLRKSMRLKLPHLNLGERNHSRDDGLYAHQLQAQFSNSFFPLLSFDTLCMAMSRLTGHACNVLFSKRSSCSLGSF